MKNKNRISIALVICLMAVASVLVSCEEEYGYAPVYGKVYCTPASPVAGDTVVLKVPYAQEGNGCYQAKYTWSITGDTTFKYTLMKTDPLLAEPELKFAFSGAGRYYISFSASFNLSMPSKSGGIYDAASAQVATLTVSKK